MNSMEHNSYCIKAWSIIHIWP